MARIAGLARQTARVRAFRGGSQGSRRSGAIGRGARLDGPGGYECGCAAAAIAHVRDLFVRRDWQGARDGVVGWTGDVAGVREPGISVAGYDLDGALSVAAGAARPCDGFLGNVLLLPGVAKIDAADLPGARRAGAFGDCLLPGDANIWAGDDHWEPGIRLPGNGARV